MLIDSHCHLDDYLDLKDVLKKARENDVKGILSVACKMDEWEKLNQICETNIWGACGVHPYYAQQYSLLKKSAFEPKNIIAVGECGLDYQDPDLNKELQKKAFIYQINLAQELKLPLIIHSRNADYDMWDILKSEFNNCNFKAVLHCYTSSWDLLKNCLDLNFFVSASGIITFKKCDDVRKNFINAPLDKILIETDGPYLAPEPYRGKLCEPFMIKNTALKLAEIKNVDFDTISEITTQNFCNLFNVKINL